MSTGEVAVGARGDERLDSGGSAGWDVAGLAAAASECKAAGDEAAVANFGAGALAAGRGGRLRGSGTLRTTCATGCLTAWAAGL